VTENKWSKKFYVNIQGMGLLSEVLEKDAKEIILQLEIGDLDKKLLDELTRILANHKGHQILTISLKDKINKRSFKAQSNTNKVSIGRSFLNELEEIDLIKFSLN